MCRVHERKHFAMSWISTPLCLMKCASVVGKIAGALKLGFHPNSIIITAFVQLYTTYMSMFYTFPFLVLTLNMAFGMFCFGTAFVWFYFGDILQPAHCSTKSTLWEHPFETRCFSLRVCMYIFCLYLLVDCTGTCLSHFCLYLLVDCTSTCLFSVRVVLTYRSQMLFVHILCAIAPFVWMLWCILYRIVLV